MPGYLANGKLRQLEFKSTDDLRFAQVLSEKGIMVE
jgi:hypothetical protein